MADALHDLTVYARHPANRAAAGCALTSIFGAAFAGALLLTAPPAPVAPGPPPERVLSTHCTALALDASCRRMLPEALQDLPSVDDYANWRAAEQAFEPLVLPDPRPGDPVSLWVPPPLPRPDTVPVVTSQAHLEWEAVARDWSRPTAAFAPEAPPATGVDGLGVLTDDVESITLYQRVRAMQQAQLEEVARARRIWWAGVRRDEIRRRNKVLELAWLKHDISVLQASVDWSEQLAASERARTRRTATAGALGGLGALSLLFGGVWATTRPVRIRVTGRTLTIAERTIPLHDIAHERWEARAETQLELMTGERIQLQGHRLHEEDAWDLSDATRSGMRATADSAPCERSRQAVQRLAESA